MEMAQVISAVGSFLAVIGSICAIVVAINNKKKDDKNDGKEQGQVLTQLGYMQSGIDDIKKSMKESDDKRDKQYVEMVQRITNVEASAKQAHRRIDELTGKKYPGT